VADCNESVRLRPGDADMLGNRGLAYLKMKKLDLALADYEAALQANPKNAFSLYGRGIAKRLKGDKAGADGRCRRSKGNKSRHRRGFRALRRAYAVSAASGSFHGIRNRCRDRRHALR